MTDSPCQNSKRARERPHEFEMASPHTPIQAVPGMEGALPTTPAELRELGNGAVASSSWKRAIHLFTLGIDMASSGLARDDDGNAASAAALAKANAKSGGELLKLLCNRSMCHLKAAPADCDAAIADAQSAAHADPSFEKAHMRLVMALQAKGAAPALVRAALQRGMEHCPFGKMLLLTYTRLGGAAAAPASASASAGAAAAAAADASPLAAARAAAADPAHPQHVVACADLGAALATGAFGAAKDAAAAERLLRAGAAGGDVGAQRNLGLLLLELRRAGEAAPFLHQAAEGGDAQAQATLSQLGQEAAAKQKQMHEKLVMMAAAGDTRAVEMLRELAVH
jgi:hypothetical protein